MATSLSTCFQSITAVSPPSSNNRLKPPAASSSAKWWAPLFGVSPDPDYIQNPAIEPVVTGKSDLDKPRSRFAPGCFTEEKAKQMRMKTIEMANDEVGPIQMDQPIPLESPKQFNSVGPLKDLSPLSPIR